MTVTWVLEDSKASASVHHTLSLLRLAVTQRPAAIEFKLKLANLLVSSGAPPEVKAERAREAVELLYPIAQDSADAALVLARAFNDLNVRDAAIEAANRAVDDPRHKADALVERAFALLKLGDRSGADASLVEARVFAPSHHMASRLHTNLLIEAGQFERAVELIDTSIAAGVFTTQTMADRIWIRRHLGLTIEDPSGARSMIVGTPQPPVAFGDCVHFCEALMSELRSNPDLSSGDPRRASRNVLRTERLHLPGTKAIPALLDMIRSHIANAGPGIVPHIEEQRLRLQSWAIIAKGQGFETWHIHPDGVISGCYYVAVPSSVRDGVCRAGCLEVGLPPLEPAKNSPCRSVAQAESANQIIRPAQGMLVLFPSYLHHRTYPTGTDDEQRICIAFDAVPVFS